MSYKMTADVMELDLPASEKLVLLALAHSHNKKTGACYPSRNRLAKLSGLAKSTVGEQLHRLADRGLISYKPGNGRVPNHYILTIQPTGSRCVKPESNPPAPESNPPADGFNPPAPERNPPAAGIEQGVNKEVKRKEQEVPQDLNNQPKSKALTRDEKKKVDAVRVKKLKEAINNRVAASN